MVGYKKVCGSEKTPERGSLKGVSRFQSHEEQSRYTRDIYVCLSTREGRLPDWADALQRLLRPPPFMAIASPCNRGSQIALSESGDSALHALTIWALATKLLQ